MRREVAADMGPSAEAFTAVVWPVLGPELGGGDLIPVEAVTAEEFGAMLDQIAGIDGWVVQQRRHIFGIASRVQFWRPEWDGQWPWNTFSIRSFRPGGVPTELQKRPEQIATPGSLYPQWTCQAYLRDGVLDSAAVALTRDVIAAALLARREVRVYSGERMRVVSWRDMWRAKCASLVVFDHAGIHRCS